MKKTLTVALCAVFLIPALAFAADDTMTAEGTGSAATAGKGSEKAFEEAKKLALRDAVEKAAGVLIQGDSMTLNSQLVRDRVFATSQGYVKKYDVVSKKEEKGVIVVNVRAEIGKADLDKDLVAVQGLVKRMGKNKLIIMLNESSVDDKGVSTVSATLATSITDILKADGWRIIDEKGTGDGEKTGVGMKIASSTAVGVPEAKELARKADADYIVYGSVAFRYQPPQSGGIIPEKNDRGEQILFFVTGEYDLQMFEVSTGRQLAKVAGKFDQKNMNQIQASKSYAQTAFDFCKRDAPRIVGELRNPVLEYLRNQDVNGAEMRMKVSGLKDFGEVSDFEKAVEQVANVRGVSANGDFDKGTQEYEVTYLGRAQDLGKALITTTYKKKKLSVVSVKNNIIEVAIAK
ncbi:MAG: hypothetical protein IPJ65_08150 [Archangiaceae bacterium]|nr:hypothetical protein [Archangiaceae bacterium]